ncbi:MAG: Threonine dehydrogenase [Labilithrix sp.]|nr:Threonine dehydrogenase [Labilithrix sp.]
MRDAAPSEPGPPPTERALWFVAPRHVELRDAPAPAPGPGEVKLRAHASGISQGTELLLYRGEGPAVFDPSLAGADAPTYPRRYGYAWVGEITAAGERTRLREGTRVFALAPHGDAHTLPEAQVRPLPEDFPATRAVLAANLETAVTCAWDAEVSLGDDVVVLGGGVVGLLTAWLLAQSGAAVTLVEPGARRREAARVLVPSALVLAAPEADGSADVVVEATGNPALLDVAIAWTRPEGRLVVASFYGTRRAAIDLGDAFHRGRLSLRASQVSHIPPRLRERWSPQRRWLFVLSLLRERALDALIAEPVPFEEAPVQALYRSLDTDTDLPPAHVLRYR